MNKNKNLAFTLAEVLIVIGIIGVVAALTLPNLNHATGDKEKVTKVKKIYSALTEAVDRAQVIYGPMDEWFNINMGWDETDEMAAKRITEFMKVSNDCGFNAGCFSDSTYLNPFGDDDGQGGFLSYLQGFDAYMVTLADGMSLAFMTRDFGEGNDTLYIKVDIDGPNKGKNQYGNDIFDFTINLDNREGANLKNILRADTYGLPVDCVPISYITSWVINFDNLDYLKATPLDGNWYKLKCNDNPSVILDSKTNTSCH